MPHLPVRALAPGANSNPAVMVEGQCVIPPAAVLFPEVAAYPRKSPLVELEDPNGSSSSNQSLVDPSRAGMEIVAGLSEFARHRHQANAVNRHGEHATIHPFRLIIQFPKSVQFRRKAWRDVARSRRVFPRFPLELLCSNQLSAREFSGHADRRNHASYPMKPLGLLILVLVIGVPIAWFASEFQGRRWLRLILGSLAILLSFGVATTRRLD